MSGDPRVGGSEELVPRDGVREGQGRTGWGVRGGGGERFPAAAEALWRPAGPPGLRVRAPRLAGLRALNASAAPRGPGAFAF